MSLHPLSTPRGISVSQARSELAPLWNALHQEAKSSDAQGSAALRLAVKANGLALAEAKGSANPETLRYLNQCSQKALLVYKAVVEGQQAMTQPPKPMTERKVTWLTSVLAAIWNAVARFFGFGCTGEQSPIDLSKEPVTNRYISGYELQSRLERGGVQVFSVRGDGFCGPRASIVSGAFAENRLDPVRDEEAIRKLEDENWEQAQAEALGLVLQRRWSGADAMNDALNQVCGVRRDGSYVGAEFFNWRAQHEGVPYLVLQHNSADNHVQGIIYGNPRQNRDRMRLIMRRGNHYFALKPSSRQAREALINQCHALQDIGR